MKPAIGTHPHFTLPCLSSPLLFSFLLLSSLISSPHSQTLTLVIPSQIRRSQSCDLSCQRQGRLAGGILSEGMFSLHFLYSPVSPPPRVVCIFESESFLLRHYLKAPHQKATLGVLMCSESAVVMFLIPDESRLNG